MAEVFAIRYIKLRPKIKIEEFEAFLARTVATLPSLPKARWYVAKGDQGDRAGRFAVIYRYTSIEIRDHYAPEEDLFSIDSLEYLTALGDFIIEVDRYGTSFGELVLFTDYAVIGEF